MSKYSELFEYMRECPALRDLWSIGATEDEGVSVIMPAGTSPAVQYIENGDVCGHYEATIKPYLSVYEDYAVNCYKIYDVNDSSAPRNNINVLSLDDVQSICDWVEEQNDNNNFPHITDRHGNALNIVSIECYPFNPQIRYVNEQEGIIAYYITVRIRYVNPRRGKTVEYEQ